MDRKIDELEDQFKHIAPDENWDVKLLRVPLARVRVSAESLALQQQKKMKPLPDLTIPDDIAKLAILLHPPVVIAGPQGAGDYLTVDDGRFVEWLQDRMDPRETATYKVPALVVSAPSQTVGAVAAASNLLVPIMIGTFSTREVRRASQQLEAAGIARPRKRRKRHQLLDLVDR